MTEICDLCVKYGTDKGTEAMGGWGYSPHYFAALAYLRDRAHRVLEVGICGYRDIPNNVVGASLWVWHDFFPNAKIYGVDNDAKFMVNTDRISSMCVDAYNPDALHKAIDAAGIPVRGLDFIVDDAVHEPLQQVTLLRELLPYLAQDGIYSIEDVCPVKLPNGDLRVLVDCMPEGLVVEVIRTHKPEVLLLVRRGADPTSPTRLSDD